MGPNPKPQEFASAIEKKQVAQQEARAPAPAPAAEASRTLLCTLAFAQLLSLWFHTVPEAGGILSLFSLCAVASHTHLHCAVASHTQLRCAAPARPERFPPRAPPPES